MKIDLREIGLEGMYWINLRIWSNDRLCEHNNSSLDSIKWEVS
jgi:hypothetical protein